MVISFEMCLRTGETTKLAGTGQGFMFWMVIVSYWRFASLMSTVMRIALVAERVKELRYEKQAPSETLVTTSAWIQGRPECEKPSGVQKCIVETGLAINLGVNSAIIKPMKV